MEGTLWLGGLLPVTRTRLMSLVMERGAWRRDAYVFFMKCEYVLLCLGNRSKLTGGCMRQYARTRFHLSLSSVSVCISAL